VQGLVGELQGAQAPPAVALDQSLERELGLGSLERVELSVRLEQAFGVQLPDAAVMEAESARDLVRALARAAPAPPGAAWSGCGWSPAPPRKGRCSLRPG